MDEVHWTQPALQDLDDIGAYIALDNPKAAETVVRRIIESRVRFELLPPDRSSGRVEGTHELV